MGKTSFFIGPREKKKSGNTGFLSVYVKKNRRGNSCFQSVVVKKMYGATLSFFIGGCEKNHEG